MWIGRSGAVPGTARGAWTGLAGAPELAEVRMVATRVVAGPRWTGSAALLGPPYERQPQISRNRTSFALRWMNERRCSTSSPIKIENISSARAASSRVTCSRIRLFGSMVVSHS